MSMRRACLAVALVACGLAFAGAGQATVTYMYEGIRDDPTEANGSFSYTAADFLTANTTVSPGALDSCNSFADTVCDVQTLYVDTGVLYGEDRNDAIAVGSRNAFYRYTNYSYFVDGALGAAGVYHAMRNGSDHSTLTVTDNGIGGGTAGIPEPATWAVMLVGFAGIGAALRRRGLRAA